MEQAGVEVVVDLEGVGENLQDHVHGFVVAYTNMTCVFHLYTLSAFYDLQLIYTYPSHSTTVMEAGSNTTFAAEQLQQYYDSKTGTYATAPCMIALLKPSVIFSNSSNSTSSGESDFQTLLSDASSNASSWASYYANGNEGVAKGIEKQYEIQLALYEQDDQLPIEINYGSYPPHSIHISPPLLYLNNALSSHRAWLWRYLYFRPYRCLRLRCRRTRRSTVSWFYSHYQQQRLRRPFGRSQVLLSPC